MDPARSESSTTRAAITAILTRSNRCSKRSRGLPAPSIARPALAAGFTQPGADDSRNPEDRSMPHGKICYLEIPASKAEDAAEFYSKIFGWSVRQRGDGNLAFDDAGSVSGTWVKEEDHTPDERTRVYIMVDSITASLNEIQAAGGR